MTVNLQQFHGLFKSICRLNPTAFVLSYNADLNRNAMGCDEPIPFGGTMKILRHLIGLIMLPAIAASGATADVNAVLTFTNFTEEELYVELSIFDNSGWRIYDLYVQTDGTSIADFWTDAIDATYSACGYGEFSGDFYGCAHGGIADYYYSIYFDITAEPYLSTPSDLPTELFAFENPYQTADIVIIETDNHDSAGCFIGGLSQG